MQCEVGEYLCLLKAFYVDLQPHLPWIGFVFGGAMAFWRWWDGREAVLYRRANRRLNERGTQVRAACRTATSQILWPSPGAVQNLPSFVAAGLGAVFEDAGWRPLFRFQDPLAHAAGKLKDGHSELAEKYKTHRQQKSFLVEQRFSAFLLQGVIASMQANELAGTDRSRRNHEALRHFEAALSVESKKSDPLALELKGLQLIKMDRIDEAHQVLESVEASAAAMLGGAAELEDVQRVQLEVQRIRIARYRAELHHRAGSHHTANIIMNPIASSVGRRELAGQDLLERAQFHELHACIRVSFAKTLNAQNPAEGVAAASIRAAKNDYQSINEALDDREFSWPSRLWRALFNLDKRDGTARLRAEAEAGLSRVQMIAGLSGCSVCGVRLQPRDNSNTTAKPIATDTRN